MEASKSIAQGAPCLQKEFTSSRLSLALSSSEVEGVMDVAGDLDSCFNTSPQLQLSHSEVKKPVQGAGDQASEQPVIC